MITLRAVPCGLTAPDFELNPSFGSERCGISLPDALFDASNVPYVASAFTRADTALTSEPIAVVLGATLADPANDPWPGVATGNWSDMDGDGRVGVTATFSRAPGYSLPRVSPGGTLRMDRAYMAWRIVLTLRGLQEGCDGLRGSAQASALEQRFPGCHVFGGGDCTNGQAAGVDAQRTQPGPTLGSFRALRVNAASSCAAIRALAF